MSRTFVVKTNEIADYNLGTKLGEGGFGAVFEGTKISGKYQGVKYAIKIIFSQRDFLQEEASLKMLSYIRESCHPNIVCMYDYGVQKITTVETVERIRKVGGREFSNVTQDLREMDAGYIVMELMDKDVYDLMRENPGGLPDVILLKGMLELLHALDYIFSKGASHRDIKPANILVKGESLFKIADFGLMCLERPKSDIPSCTSVGTLAYSAPELGKNWGMKLSLGEAQKGDIWALGLVFYLMAYGYGMFDVFDSSNVDEWISFFNRIRQRDVDIPEDLRSSSPYGRVVRVVINNMIRVNPNQRKSPRELIEYINAQINPCKDNPAVGREYIISLLSQDSDSVNSFIIQKGYPKLAEMRTNELCSLYNDYMTYLASLNIVPERESIEVETRSLGSRGTERSLSSRGTERSYGSSRRTESSMDSEFDDLVEYIEEMGVGNSFKKLTAQALEEEDEDLKAFAEELENDIFGPEFISVPTAVSNRNETCLFEDIEMSRDMIEFILSSEQIYYEPQESDGDLCYKLNSLAKDKASVKNMINARRIFNAINEAAYDEVMNGMTMDQTILTQGFTSKADEIYGELGKFINENSENIDIGMTNDYAKDIEKKLGLSYNDNTEQGYKEAIFYTRQLFIYNYFQLVNLMENFY